MSSFKHRQQCLRLYPVVLHGEPTKSRYQRGEGESGTLRRRSVIHNIYKQNLNLLMMIQRFGMETSVASSVINSEKDY